MPDFFGPVRVDFEGDAAALERTIAALTAELERLKREADTPGSGAGIANLERQLNNVRDAAALAASTEERFGRESVQAAAAQAYLADRIQGVRNALIAQTIAQDAAGSSAEDTGRQFAIQGVQAETAAAGVETLTHALLANTMAQQVAAGGGGVAATEGAFAAAAGGGGGRQGGVFGRFGPFGMRLGAGVGAILTITPLAGIIESALTAVASLVAVGGAMAAVAGGAIYFANEFHTAGQSLFNFDKGIAITSTALAQAGATIEKSISGQAHGALGQFQTDLLAIISQSTPLITHFIHSLAGLGQGLANFFLMPGSNGQSVFQQWGQIITGFVSHAGGGLISVFEKLQGPAMAFVQGIGNLFGSIGHFSSSIIGPLAPVLTNFFKFFFADISGLIGGWAKWSNAADGVSVAILKLVQTAMPAFNSGVNILATGLHGAALLFSGFLGGLGHFVSFLNGINPGILGTAVAVGVLAKAFVALRSSAIYGMAESAIANIGTSLSVGRDAGMLAGFAALGKGPSKLAELIQGGGFLGAAGTILSRLALPGVIAGIGFEAYQGIRTQNAAENYIRQFGLSGPQSPQALGIIRGRMSDQTGGGAQTRFAGMANEAGVTAQARINQLLAEGAQRVANATAASQRYAFALAGLYSATAHLTQLMPVQAEQFRNIAQLMNQTPGAFQAVLEKTHGFGRNFNQIMQQADQAVMQWRQQAAQSMNFAGTAFQKFQGQANVSIGSLISSLTRARNQQNQWGSDMRTILGDGARRVSGFVQAMVQGGPQMLGVLNSVAGASRTQRDQVYRLYNQMQSGAQNTAAMIQTKLFGTITQLNRLLQAIARKWNVQVGISGVSGVLAGLHAIIAAEGNAFAARGVGPGVTVGPSAFGQNAGHVHFTGGGGGSGGGKSGNALGFYTTRSVMTTLGLMGEGSYSSMYGFGNEALMPLTPQVFREIGVGIASQMPRQQMPAVNVYIQNALGTPQELAREITRHTQRHLLQHNG